MIKIKMDEYQEPFTELGKATDYFFDQLKLFPVFGYLIENDAQYVVLINIPLPKGAKPIMQFRIDSLTLANFSISIPE